jgi:hypothetical protein
MLGALALLSATPSYADLALTPAGTADGFSLSEFVSGFANNGPGGEGPFGIATTTNGNVLVNSYFDSRVYRFNDVDGQTVAAALGSTALQSFAADFVNAGGTIYASGGLPGVLSSPAGDSSRGGPDANNLLTLTNTGALATTALAGGAAVGVAVDAVNGHIFALRATDFGLLGIPAHEQLIDYNPGTGTSTVLWTRSSSDQGDSVAVSADGRTAYVSFKGLHQVIGFDTTTGAQTTSFDVAAPDGLGVIHGTSPFAGDLISNNNDGTVALLNVGTGGVTTIASGGSRGDFTGQDLLNGSLFLTQTDSVWRLSCGEGCDFGGGAGGTGGGGGTAVPEPGTWSLLGLGVVALGLARRRSRNGLARAVR